MVGMQVPEATSYGTLGKWLSLSESQISFCKMQMVTDLLHDGER